MKADLKSILIEERIHYMAKRYCAEEKLTIKEFVERLIVIGTEKVKQPPKKKK